MFQNFLEEKAPLGIITAHLAVADNKIQQNHRPMIITATYFSRDKLEGTNANRLFIENIKQSIQNLPLLERLRWVVKDDLSLKRLCLLTGFLLYCGAIIFPDGPPLSTPLKAGNLSL